MSLFALVVWTLDTGIQVQKGNYLHAALAGLVALFFVWAINQYYEKKESS